MLCEHGNIAPCVECDVEPLKAENGALRARVAGLEDALVWALGKLSIEVPVTGGNVTYIRAFEKADKALSSDGRAYLLRKQAEAVGSLRFPTMMRKMWSGGEVQGWLDDQAKLFSDEADEAERAGGEK